MKKVIGAIIVSAALGMLPWETGAFAADFAVPHTFKGGDVVSADELNERLDNLEQANIDYTAADLVGAWSCPVNAKYSSSYWTVSPDGLSNSSTMTLTFTMSGSALYLSVTCPPFVSVYTNDLCPIVVSSNISSYAPLTNARVSLVNGFALTPYNVIIKKRSNTRFELNTFTLGNAATLLTSYSNCDKQNIAPLKPSNLIASVSGTSITLSWTDNSTDETGFDVLRKDTSSGTYTVVGSVTANTTTYLNSPVTTGTHWYRVRAKNANGSSLGSNVVKVTN